MIYLFKVENKIRKDKNMENLEKQLIGEVEKELLKWIQIKKQIG